MAGSGHEQMLRDYFPGVQAVTYTTAGLALCRPEGRQDRRHRSATACGSPSGWPDPTPAAAAALPAGPTWRRNISAPDWPSPRSVDDPQLAAAFDYALQQIAVKGRFAELYLRYFPVSFY